MTDNKNRTAAEVRALFTRAGGSFAPVSWQFEHRGVLSVPLNGNDPDEVSLAAIDAGAVGRRLAGGRRDPGRDRSRPTSSGCGRP